MDFKTFPQTQDLGSNHRYLLYRGKSDVEVSILTNWLLFTQALWPIS
jgi:hypothetical protein